MRNCIPLTPYLADIKNFDADINYDDATIKAANLLTVVEGIPREYQETAKQLLNELRTKNKEI